MNLPSQVRLPKKRALVSRQSEEGGIGPDAALRNLSRPVSDSGSETHASAFNTMPESLVKSSVPGGLCVLPSIPFHRWSPSLREAA